MAKDSLETLQKAIEAQARHTQQLMLKRHVVGVAVGTRKVSGKATEEVCLVVMVDLKVPMQGLPEEDRVPEEIDGVKVDVQEVGNLLAQ